MNLLVTGGAGFVGSNFIRYLLENDLVEEVINYDKKTYAGEGRNIEYMGLDRDPRYRFVYGDICDKFLVRQVLRKTRPDYIFNFAAETHVDRSLQDAATFRRTNVVGTGNLLDASESDTRFIQISTDEVYGSIQEGSFKETDEPNPSNPYAKTKYGAEVVVRHFAEVCEREVVITRSANNYGPYQFPEKFLPRSITELLEGRNIPLMWSEENQGLNVRDWLHVEDNCRAIWHLAINGKPGETYNIPGNNERTNIEIARIILKHFRFGEDRIQRIPHRFQHDFRYSIDGIKLTQTGFQYKHSDLERGIEELCDWYQENPDWWRPLKK